MTAVHMNDAENGERHTRDERHDDNQLLVSSEVSEAGRLDIHSTVRPDKPRNEYAQVAAARPYPIARCHREPRSKE